MRYTLDEIAKQVKAIQKSVEELKTSELNDKTIAMLISQNTNPKVGIKLVEAVLESMETLEFKYLRDFSDD